MHPQVLCLTPQEVLAPAYRAAVAGLPPHVLVYPATRGPADVRAAIPDADVVIGDWTGQLRLTAADFDAAPRLRAVLQPTAGVDSIDVGAAAEREIPVANTPGANAVAVAEWVVMAILAMMKAVPQMDLDTRAGRWRMVEAARDGVFEVADRVVGIVGMGLIGREVVTRIRGFGPREIVYTDVAPLSAAAEQRLGVRRVDLDELFRVSDAVTLHVPLLDATKGLVGRPELQLLGPNGVLVNTARAGVVDSDALAAALDQGVIKGAALDVFDQEPLPAGHRWADARNVLLSPHLAGSTNESRFRMIAGCLQNLDRLLLGRPIVHIVNAVLTPREAGAR